MKYNMTITNRGPLPIPYIHTVDDIQVVRLVAGGEKVFANVNQITTTRANQICLHVKRELETETIVIMPDPELLIEVENDAA